MKQVLNRLASAVPILSYDGTFSGFLCAAAEAINADRKGFPFPSIRRESPVPELFDETIRVRTDEARAARLWERLGRLAGEKALRACFEAFCSDLACVEDALARVLARMSGEGRTVLADLADPDSLRVMEASRRTQGQAHKLKGLVRFAELADGSWYAALEPDCDVLSLLGEHFTARYAGMRFILHDRRRAKVLVHKPGRPWKIVRGFGPAGEVDPPISEGESAIRAGWRLYFASVAIAERKNPRLQANHMPKKYWHLLPEMGDSLSGT
ncbi:MAG: TIGR03915 family putative DNA repair protein [Spirochaetes bacterium]|nr:TIGR03915 family putative DNA repair protein [Spirochaetota bacterium]